MCVGLAVSLDLHSAEHRTCKELLLSQSLDANFIEVHTSEMAPCMRTPAFYITG